ncbi:18754_t:CDS:2 [Racocetra fulgida]|uniref:18754_t:CDS:1 n=1 Tax=Racocetra fulgida TaxID=60492 RepID=A0A9N9EJA8_9GLOM|nr:18754_t:CDS:2 [Racocetra fulgida]
MKYALNEHYHGYAEMCKENLDITRKNGDVKESFSFGEFNDENEAKTQILPPFFKERAEFIASFLKVRKKTVNFSHALSGLLCLKIFQIFAMALEIQQSEEIQPPNTDKWFPVPVIPNHVLINIGDCLSFWTKGLFKSIMHRVSFDSENFSLDRHSIAYFCIAGSDIKLDPIPSKFIPTNEKNKDEKILTAGEHLMRRASAAYGNY